MKRAGVVTAAMFAASQSDLIQAKTGIPSEIEMEEKV